jgi:hypothetical protein
VKRSRIMTAGTPVLVRNRFNGEWAPDFQIVAVEAEGCLIRRNRDGAVLPSVFAWDELRASTRFARPFSSRPDAGSPLTRAGRGRADDET